MKKDRVPSTLRTQVLLVSVLLSTLGLLAFGLTLAVPASAATLSASAAAASAGLPAMSIPAAATPATAGPNAEASAASAANMVSAAAAGPAALAPATAGDFVFSGRGWGHAVGMSQWGAWYAARNGTSFSDILAFYYPGTTLAPLTDPNTIVKVKISSEPWKSVSSITQDYSRVELEPTVAPMTLVEHSSAGDASEDIPLGTVVTVTNVAGEVEVSTPAGDEGPFDYVEARPAVAAPPVGDSPATSDGRVKITLWTGDTTKEDAREYWGTMRVQQSSAAGKLWVYNYVPIDKYVRSIAEVEYDWAMPSSTTAYAPEAVKAQAVAARSYAAAKGFSVQDNQYDQCYRGYTFEAQYPGIAQAADDTAGLVLWYQGKVVLANFSASSGGYTTRWNDSDPPYLPIQADPWSLAAPPANLDAAGPGYNWTFTISAQDLSTAVDGHLHDTAGHTVDLGLINLVQVVDRDAPDPASHAKTLQLTGENGTALVRAESFRALFGYSKMRSTLILSVVSPAPLAEGEYYDVGPGYLYHDQIARVTAAGLMSGYDSGLFKPEAPVLRWQFAKIAVCLHNELYPDDQIPVVDVAARPFSDVPLQPGVTGDASDWVAAAKTAGLVEGVTDTTFQPYEEVRRDQMASMLVRALGWEAAAAAMTPGTPGFADVPVSSTHWAAATYLKTKGILQGYEEPVGSGNLVLRVADPTLRKHVAAILCRVLDLPR